VNYTYSTNYNDTDGPFSLPANNYNLPLGVGAGPPITETSLSDRNQTAAGPEMFSLNPIPCVQRKAVHITTGYDNFNDGVTNARPDGVGRATQAEGLVSSTAASTFENDSCVQKQASRSGWFPRRRWLSRQREPEAVPEPPTAGSFGGEAEAAHRWPKGWRQRGHPNVGTTATVYMNIQNVFNHRTSTTPAVY